MKKAVQKFSSEYLATCKSLKPNDILKFLEDFRLLHGGSIKTKSKLISIKIPENLLQAFRNKSELNNTPYQSQIKKLMLEWLASTP